MKKHLFLFSVVFFSQFVFSQSKNFSTANVAEAEMKSGSKLMDLLVNPNTQNYDVTYHKLEFTVNPSVFSISGKVTTTYTALSNMSMITFDFSKITSPSDPNYSNKIVVSSVKKNGINLSFVHSNTNELVITLPSVQPAGDSGTIEISYSGAPKQSGFGSFNNYTHSGSPVLWTLSEPYGARDWWPCKQDLNDKVDSIDVYITAPSIFTSVSNGLEQSQVIIGANKTTHFHHNYPIPAYLIAIAVTNYTVYNQQAGLGTVASPFFPIVNYLYPETALATQTSLSITPAIVNLFETLVGPYPFRNEKYGHAQFGWGGGMEHTTVSFMGVWDREIISHELAHQWFGDKVTCATWKDIWLNEGLTEYMSGVVVQNMDGENNFVNWKNQKINSITSVYNGNLYLTDLQANDVNRIFDGRLTYDKGSMVAHMLRFKLGDAVFFQALRNYLNDPALAYGYATTAQFKSHLEAVYGSSLTNFFSDWVYKEGFPTYYINVHNSNPGQVTIQISQTQSIVNSSQTGYVSYFEMPVPVRLTGSSGQQLDVVLDNTSNGQTFVVPVGFVVTGVQFDPNKNIISRSNVISLGVENFDFAAAIQMYPNPASDVLTIDIPQNMTLQKVSLYNTLGQKTLESSQNKINVSQLTSGMYVVAFETSEGTYHKNFIKK